VRACLHGTVLHYKSRFAFFSHNRKDGMKELVLGSSERNRKPIAFIAHTPQ
jgi:hypothetical protein